MASRHAGLFVDLPSIEKARRDPTQCFEWGCDRPKQIEAGTDANGEIVYYKIPILTYPYDGGEAHLLRHPLFFVSDTVNNWFEQYKWDGREAGSFKEVHPLYRDFCDIYEYYLSYFRRAKNARSK